MTISGRTAFLVKNVAIVKIAPRCVSDDALTLLLRFGHQLYPFAESGDFRYLRYSFKK